MAKAGGFVTAEAVPIGGGLAVGFGIGAPRRKSGDAMDATGRGYRQQQ